MINVKLLVVLKVPLQAYKLKFQHAIRKVIIFIP